MFRRCCAPLKPLLIVAVVMLVEVFLMLSRILNQSRSPFVGLLAAFVLLALLMYGVAHALAFEGAASGSAPTLKHTDGLVEYSVIRAAHASDDWDDPVVIERRVVAEKDADTVYKAKAEVLGNRSIPNKAKVFLGKEKKGFFGRLFNRKKTIPNDAAFNAALSAGDTRTVSELEADLSGAELARQNIAAQSASFASDGMQVPSSIVTGELDWKENEFKIPAKGISSKVKKDPFALTAQEKKDLGLETAVNYEADLIQAMGVQSNPAAIAKLRRSMQPNAIEAKDHSISSNHKMLLRELESLKKQEALNEKLKAQKEGRAEAQRLLRVKRELMLELHEQKKARREAKSRADQIGLDDWQYDGIVTSSDRKYRKKRSFKKERTPYNLKDSYEDYEVFEDKGWEYEEGKNRWLKDSAKSKKSKRYKSENDDWE